MSKKPTKKDLQERLARARMRRYHDLYESDFESAMFFARKHYPTKRDCETAIAVGLGD